MKLSLDALAMLDAIDTAGSFAAAARHLHRVPSALTHAVRRLEDDLGFSIFQRAGRRAELTAAGRTLLDDGRALLNAAAELECRARRVATGWEAELRIAINALIRFEDFLPVMARFYAEQRGTRLRIEREVLAGSWDALTAGRADLVIGASGEAPPSAGLVSRRLGHASLLFCVAPQHPLARHPEPIPTREIRKHRAIVLADTTRLLAPRTAGLLEGQETLVVPDFVAKIAAQKAGLGVGHIPPQMAAEALAEGSLCARQTELPTTQHPVYLAWRSSHDGHALRWFLDQLGDEACRAGLIH
ncbi:MAG: LysR family transcriptional regulator [Rhodocyclaceae bacterium]|nr:LysR family transcriptional regulator [Rhodocyclaceae bacterium]